MNLKKQSFKLSSLILIAICFFTLNESKAQDLGADLVSSYVWRGTQFGSGAHIQPWVSLSSGDLEVGAWGSFPTTAAGGGNELDLYASYSFGKFGLTLTNYSFPGEGGAYADGEGLFEGDYLEISGSAELGPINLLVGYFTEVEALYIEAAFSAGPVDVAIGYGNDSADAWYVNGGSGLCNISLGGSKDIKITEDYTLPLFGSFVYNPDSEAAFLVFGASF